MVAGSNPVSPTLSARHHNRRSGALGECEGITPPGVDGSRDGNAALASPPISTSWRSTSRRSTPTPGSRCSTITSTPSKMPAETATDDQAAEGRAEDPHAGEQGIATRSPRLPRDTPSSPYGAYSPGNDPFPQPWPARRSVTERRRPAAKVRTAPRQLAANDSNDTASRFRRVRFVDPPIPLPRKGTQCVSRSPRTGSTTQNSLAGLGF